MNQMHVHDMVPVFNPEDLGLPDGSGFREGLQRLAERGELKARLLEVALSHFAARGYDGVQVREVAEEAGVSKPTLYYHFGSKEGLFRQLCLVALAFTEYRTQAMVKPLLELDLADPAVRTQACHRLVRTYLDLLQEMPEFTGFILRSIAVPSPDSGFRDLMPVVERGLSPLGLFIHHAFGLDFEKSRKELILFTGIFGALIEEKLRHPGYAITQAEIEWATTRWLKGLEG
ncbi:MAG TPA: TetR/AcrR family transcriptional regulator [Holophagaceae bacterium]|nr:TetR/AcrR family transcriptional regulator [Holophagaceae bacterium]